MRAVLDTNVLLSGLLRGRTTRPILHALMKRRFSLVTSAALIGELTHVLSRPEWRRTLGSSDCRELLAILHEAASHAPAIRHAITVCRDPEDTALLECAVAGRADYLVTGDLDLLSLHPFRGIRIVRPAEFLRLLP